MKIKLTLPNRMLASNLAASLRAMGREVVESGLTISSAFDVGDGIAVDVPLLGSIGLHHMPTGIEVRTRPSVGLLLSQALPTRTMRLDRGETCLTVDLVVGRSYPLAIPVIGAVYIQVEEG